MEVPCTTLYYILVFFLIVLLTMENYRIVVLGTQCNQTNSFYDKRLRNHVIRKSFESKVFDCVLRCKADSLNCQSMNYRTTDKLCQLNSASKTSHIQDFGPEPGFIYMENPYAKMFQSCFELKAFFPSKPSGYYYVMIGDRGLNVYCDMDNYGGGWTLVVSISNQNNKHLLSTQHNCLNHSLCVPYGGDAVTATRKLPDHEIRLLAKGEGTLRVRKLASTPYDVFFRIPSGQDKFDSSCSGNGCPRISVSYVPYPYVWESNPCDNNSIGYRIPNTPSHKVFSGGDDGECGPVWKSSLYSTKHPLYGYVHRGHKGLYKRKNGMLFVR